MNTLEMIKAITEDKTKEFKAVTINSSICTVKFVDDTSIAGCKKALKWIQEDIHFQLNEITLGYTWEEVQKPMTFMEAMKLVSKNNCDLYVTTTSGYKHIYTFNGRGLLDENNKGTTPSEVLTGKWYVHKK